MSLQKLAQWLQWLEARKVVRTPPQALKALKTVIEQLNLLPITVPVITVGGTNGKGSCVAMLEAIYQAAGYKVGSFTSPHLIRFNERIRVNKSPVTDAQVCAAFEKINAVRAEQHLNYFQFSFLAALIIFAAQPLDLIILEVGIGGRYDAVNIIEPDLSIIASIDLDHCAILGETREIIGQDKAGIMRSGKPTICGDLAPPQSIFTEAAKVGANLYCQNRDFSFKEHADGWDWQGIGKQYNNLPKPKTIELINAATVLMAVTCLQAKLPVTAMAIQQGLKQVEIEGRCQLVTYNGINILFDVAHNPAAAKMLRKQVARLQPKGNIYAVVGMFKDKDITGVLSNFKDIITQWFFTHLPDPRSAGAEDFIPIISLPLAGKRPREGHFYQTPTQALKAATEIATSADLIVVFGSFVLVGELLPFAISTSIV